MQIVLITGPGRKGNLGYETARQLGGQGYHVILAARKPEEQMAALVKELTDAGAKASFVQMDITSEESVKNAAASIEKEFGRVDVLINNAAVMQAGDPVETQDMEQTRRVFDANVIGTWNVTQKFIPLLRKSAHGRIVNVSSGAGSYRDPQYGFLDGAMGLPCSGYGISQRTDPENSKRAGEGSHSGKLGMSGYYGYLWQRNVWPSGGSQRKECDLGGYLTG